MSLNMKPLLIVFSGLPGVGKTTLAKKLAEYYKAAYFRIDTIEQGLRDLCKVNVQGEGYRLTYRIAKDNLAIGNAVVIDCCNPWNLTRDEWEQVSIQSNALLIDIEIVCKDKVEHKLRVIKRHNDIENLILPSWEEIEKRKYEEWTKAVIRIDTSNYSIEQSFRQITDEIKKEKYLTTAPAPKISDRCKISSSRK